MFIHNSCYSRELHSHFPDLPSLQHKGRTVKHTLASLSSQKLFIIPIIYQFLYQNICLFLLIDTGYAGRVGLVVSFYKTKYMRFSASSSRRSIKGANINGVIYEGVAEFIYLGTLISNDNSVQKEIQRSILAGNRT
jgi:hypothetical protein